MKLGNETRGAINGEGRGCAQTSLNRRLVLKALAVISLLLLLGVAAYYIHAIMQEPVEDAHIGLTKESIRDRYGTPTRIWTYELGDRPMDELRAPLSEHIPHCGPEEQIQEHCYIYPNGDRRFFWFVKGEDRKWTVFSDYFLPRGWES